MLNANQDKIIQSTLPQVASNLKIIVQKFYELLFINYPQLKSLFNQTNQKTQQQQEALASSIAQFAMNYHDLEKIKPMLQQIAHKHCSVGITKDQYQIVGATLISAIQHVLGDIITPEILDAWGSFYWLLANTLIEIEGDLYKTNQVEENDIFKKYTVIKKVDEANSAFSLYLSPQQGVLPRFESGQYVSIKVKLNEDYYQIRQYSISRVEDNYIRLTIGLQDNHDKNTLAVSKFIYDNVFIQDVCLLSDPSGIFRLKDNENNIVMISAGVGITPLMSMLKSIVSKENSKQVKFIHLTENSSNHIFKEELFQINAPHIDKYIFYKTPLTNDICGLDYHDSPFDLNKLKQFIKPNTDYYLCASPKMINMFKSYLVILGVNNANIIYEVFQPTDFNIN